MRWRSWLQELSRIAVLAGWLLLALASGSAAADVPGCTRWHTVQQGDVCQYITARYGVALADLTAELNPGLACGNLQIGQPVCISNTSPSPTQDCDANLVRVQPNQLCWQIAAANGISVDQLLAANPGVDCLAIYIGQYLCIPGGPRAKCSKQHVVTSGDSCAAVKMRYIISLSNLAALNPGLDCSNLQVGQQLCVSDGSPPPEECSKSVEVKPGDLCWSVADGNGISLEVLYALNPETDCNLLQVGQSLCVSKAVVLANCTKRHAVDSGDTCDSLKARFVIPLRQLKELNPGLICNDPLLPLAAPGEQLCVSDATQPRTECVSLATVVQGDTCESIAAAANITLGQLWVNNPELDCLRLLPGNAICTAAPVTPEVSCRVLHEVLPGQYCWLISNNHSITVDQLRDFNPGLNCDSLQPGMRLCVGQSTGSPQADCPTSQWHVVQRNEDCDTVRTMYCLAPDFFLDTLGNRETCSSILYPGDKLCVKGRPVEKCAGADGECGIKNGARCPYPLCCSRFGYCNSDEGSCHLGCNPDYGECVALANITYSFLGGRCGESSRLEQGNPSNWLLRCSNSQCCSTHGWCGNSPQHCEGPTVCQPDFGSCGGSANQSSSASGVTGVTYSGGPCGRQSGGLVCPDSQACSVFGHCGYAKEYCQNSQKQFGTDCSQSKGSVKAALSNISFTYSGGPCGPSNRLSCPQGEGCSEYGYCGAAADDLTGDFCGAGCLPAYSWCGSKQGTCGAQLKVLKAVGASAAQMSPPRVGVLDQAVFVQVARASSSGLLSWHMEPFNISFHSVHTALMCSLLCDQTRECQTWAFSSNNDTCYRSAVRGSKTTRVFSKGWASGSRQQPFGSVALPHTVVIQDNTKFYGAAAEDGNPAPDRFWFSDGKSLRLSRFGRVVASAGACERSCKDDGNCRIFVFDKSEKKCYRYSNAYFGGKVDKDFVSGIVRHGAAPRDRLIALNATDPAPGCRCDEGADTEFTVVTGSRNLNLSDAGGTTTPPKVRDFYVPFVCQQANNSRKRIRDHDNDAVQQQPAFTDSPDAASCQAVGVPGPRTCARASRSALTCARWQSMAAERTPAVTTITMPGRRLRQPSWVRSAPGR